MIETQQVIRFMVQPPHSARCRGVSVKGGGVQRGRAGVPKALRGTMLGSIGESYIPIPWTPPRCRIPWGKSLPAVGPRYQTTLLDIKLRSKLLFKETI